MKLADVKTFDQLLPWLASNLDWPVDEIEIAPDTAFDDLTYEYEGKELGLKQEDIAHVREIRQLRPLVTNQPWGIFFVNFEDKKIPVGVLKRILGGLTIRKRQSSNRAEQKAWTLHDLLFISSFGKSRERELSFLHFAEENSGKNKTVLKELGWDHQDTQLKLDFVERTLKSNLVWPEDTSDTGAWRARWGGAFTSTHGATIRTAKDLTRRLAGLASAIRRAGDEVLEFENKNGPLTKIYENFRHTIFHNLTPPDFADMYAQTICYGLLAKQIERARSGLDTSNLSADDAALTQGVMQPFLKDLMEAFLAVGGRKSSIDFNELGVNEVVELLQAADMHAVLLDFGNRNPHEDPVLHFYEHFLRDYDSIMREQRGVYYTPLPVVRFIVRSVHEILRKEFGLADGLADTTTWGEMSRRNPALTIPKGTSADASFVQILDPATGTGTFLVEVLDLIEKHLKSKWRNEGKKEPEVLADWNEYVPAHLLPRLNGFELMMAPYAIAHIKLGMKLQESGYRPKPGEAPRVRVYLTNTLEEPTGMGRQGAMNFIMDSLALEAKGADEIKAKTAITVIIGNPPYSGHSMNNKIEWIVERVKDYRRDFPELNKPGQGKWLQDDYVKFIRYGEYRLAGAGSGVLGFITNHAYLDNPTFKGMRKRLGEEFQKLVVFDLHGNSKRGETTIDGKPDENVFAIQQGVCILAAEKKAQVGSQVMRGDLFGTRAEKNSFLGLNSLSGVKLELTQSVAPEWPFEKKDTDVEAEYRSFFGVPEIFSPNGDPAPGIVTTHDEFAISWTPQEAKGKVRTLIKTTTEIEARSLFQLCTQSQWNYSRAKTYLASTNEWEEQVVPVLYRPFDERFTVFNSHVAVHRRDRVMRHMLLGDNVALVTVRQVAEGVFNHAVVSKRIIDNRFTASNKGIGFLFPLVTYHEDHGKLGSNFNIDRLFIGKFSSSVGMGYTNEKLSFRDKAVEPKPTRISAPEALDTFSALDIFEYTYAILHSPTYRTRYADFLKSNFPRVPLPSSAALFGELVLLGQQLVPLHLLDASDAEVLSNPDTRFVSKGETRVDRGFPEYKNGKVMINGSCWFEDVTPEVWNFHIGGYQVCEKWLKDRAGRGGKSPAPGRVLSAEDILHYRRITVALRETIRLMAEIDQVIDRHGGWPDAFVSAIGNTAEAAQ